MARIMKIVAGLVGNMSTRLALLLIRLLRLTPLMLVTGLLLMIEIARKRKVLPHIRRACMCTCSSMILLARPWHRGHRLVLHTVLIPSKTGTWPMRNTLTRQTRDGFLAVWRDFRSHVRINLSLKRQFWFYWFGGVHRMIIVVVCDQQRRDWNPALRNTLTTAVLRHISASAVISIGQHIT